MCGSGGGASGEVSSGVREDWIVLRRLVGGGVAGGGDSWEGLMMISEGGATTRAVEVGTSVVGVVLCFLVGDGLLVEEEALGLSHRDGCVSRASSGGGGVGSSVVFVTESKSGLQINSTEEGEVGWRSRWQACSLVAQTA